MIRVLLLATMAGLMVPAMAQAARACDPAFQRCNRNIVVFPAYTPEGLRIGSVADVIYRGPILEISRTTGQPLTVVYNDPTRIAGAVDPDLVLMPLPNARPSRTRAVYPVGY